VGEITSDDGKTWTMPAETAFLTAAKATDLYNACNDVTPDSVSAVDISSVPLIDAGGSEEITTYLFADNYFELHVNGQLLDVDPVPFTPLNSSIVRFKAKRPVTLAIKMVIGREISALVPRRDAAVDSIPATAVWSRVSWMRQAARFC